jgi:hypothetical protein
MKIATFRQMKAQQWTLDIGSHAPLGLRVLITEAALVFGVSRRTVWNWERRGLMPPSKRRGVRMSYSRDDILTLASIVQQNGGDQNV